MEKAVPKTAIIKYRFDPSAKPRAYEAFDF
jgi:hypothetical protein